MNFQPYAVSQSQMIGTYVPEQILRGKVLDILPDRTAIVQLGARKSIARVTALQPPLKIGGDYLFQIKQADSHPPTAVVVGHRNELQQEKSSPLSMVRDLLDAFQLKDTPANRGLAKIFLDSGEPLSRSQLVSAESLAGSTAGVSDSLRAVGWLVNRHLPLTKPFFNTAVQLMQQKSLTGQLSSLQKEIAASSLSTPSMLAVNQSISDLEKTDGFPDPVMTAGLIGREQSAQLLRDFFQNSVPAFHDDSNAMAEFINSSMSVPDAANLLNKLAVRMQPDQFLSRYHQLLLAQPAIQTLLQTANGRTPIGILFKTLEALGFNEEHSLRNQLSIDGTVQATGSLKERLLALSDDVHAPAGVRQLAGEALGKITGQQLQMVSSDPLIAQFSFQVPVPIQNKVKNLSVYWEGRRDKQGKLDPDSCVILLHLELTHLHETLITVNVQNRRISVNVQNETADLQTLLKDTEPELRDQLSALNYHLLSVHQTQKINRRLAEKAQQPLAVSNYNLDLRI
ncbi:hypothetical protein [Sporolactobacillus vineae]|uniref:hypothetical protein n=1 Tax=Sporolactobacillus vineae TaxID=444463 RepID=UPI000287DD42|nr:hypothetical protein [Sporolactobacillus vineae]